MLIFISFFLLGALIHTVLYLYISLYIFCHRPLPHVLSSYTVTCTTFLYVYLPSLLHLSFSSSDYCTTSVLFRQKQQDHCSQCSRSLLLPSFSLSLCKMFLSSCLWIMKADAWNLFVFLPSCNDPTAWYLQSFQRVGICASEFKRPILDHPDWQLQLLMLCIESQEISRRYD